jgi:DNA modification methylase
METISEQLYALEERDVYLYNDNVENLYDFWETPQVIISDGAYGVSGFRGDPVSYQGLTNWYEPHIEQWSKKAKAGTTLWFWNTEIGFAKVNPLLEKYGWEYQSCNVWNKGLQHIAGNCNLKVLKSFPIVTEVCVQYIKKAVLLAENQEFSLKDWLRYEWNRAGLTLNQSNLACGVAAAASRKYLTKDHLWYAPPPEHFENLVNFANKFGKPETKPYFSIDNKTPLSRKEYENLFAKFDGQYGITNVWEAPPLHTKERIRIDGNSKYVHLNQKPLSLMQLIIDVSSVENDVIWEPFGGLFSASLAGHSAKRKVYAAEIDESIFEIGLKRFDLQNQSKKPTQAEKLTNYAVN